MSHPQSAVPAAASCPYSKLPRYLHRRGHRLLSPTPHRPFGRCRNRQSLPTMASRSGNLATNATQGEKDMSMLSASTIVTVQASHP